MTDRQRIRVGRPVSYNPTAAEVTASGPGPWPAMITDVDADGRVDLLVHVPGDNLGAGVTPIPAALADPLVTSPDGSDAGTTQTLANELKVDLLLVGAMCNAMRLHLLDTRKNAVSRGGAPGQYNFTGDGTGSQSV